MPYKYHAPISNPASCLEPTRWKDMPSSSVLPILSIHHCPLALPSSPTYGHKQDILNQIFTLHNLYTKNQLTVLR